MKSGTARDRAKAVVNGLLTQNTSWLSSRKNDDCFEMGDGQKVLENVLKILKEKGITKKDQLPYVSQRYVGNEWFL